MTTTTTMTLTTSSSTSSTSISMIAALAEVNNVSAQRIALWGDYGTAFFELQRAIRQVLQSPGMKILLASNSHCAPNSSCNSTDSSKEENGHIDALAHPHEDVGVVVDLKILPNISMSAPSSSTACSDLLEDPHNLLNHPFLLQKRTNQVAEPSRRGDRLSTSWSQEHQHHHYLHFQFNNHEDPSCANHRSTMIRNNSNTNDSADNGGTRRFHDDNTNEEGKDNDDSYVTSQSHHGHSRKERGAHEEDLGLTGSSTSRCNHEDQQQQHHDPDDDDDDENDDVHTRSRHQVTTIRTTAKMTSLAAAVAIYNMGLACQLQATTTNNNNNNTTASNSSCDNKDGATTFSMSCHAQEQLLSKALFLYQQAHQLLSCCGGICTTDDALPTTTTSTTSAKPASAASLFQVALWHNLIQVHVHCGNLCQAHFWKQRLVKFLEQESTDRQPIMAPLSEIENEELRHDDDDDDDLLRKLHQAVYLYHAATSAAARAA